MSVRIKYQSLQIEKPDLAKEWHPTKNGSLTPDQINANSSKYAWWLGECGHEWRSQIGSRFRGTGCPYCANQAVLPGFNDLLTKYPGLAKEWHPTKNGSLLPSMVIPGSRKKVWWITPEGYEWEASIVKRVHGQQCPIYSNQKIVAGINDFQSLHPALMQEWDWEQNTVDPSTISCAYGKNVWWHGFCGHHWKSKVAYRIRGSRCPYCCGQQVLRGFNDLATLNPELASEWDYEKNDKTPYEYTLHSGIKAAWKCKKGHSWRATIASRASGTGCPVCSSEMQVSVPEKTISYYLHRDTDLTILDNYKFEDSSYELDIYCPELHLGIEYDGQAWHKNPAADRQKNLYLADKQIVLLRIREPLCPDLASSSIDFKLTDKYHSLEDAVHFVFAFLASHYEKHFICDVNLKRDNAKIIGEMEHAAWKNSIAALNPTLTQEWNTVKNGKLHPCDVPVHSGKKVWWKCSKCNYEWRSVVADRSAGKGCPVCAGKVVWPGHNDLQTLYPEIAAQWHPSRNGSLTASDVTPGSNKKVWWQCKLGHEWQAQINKRSSGRNCPYCIGKKVLSGFNDLATTNPELLAEWDYEKNSLSPSELSKGSHTKLYWICSKGHSWAAPISSRLRGSKCPVCQREVLRVSSCKPVIQFDLTSNQELNRYPSQREASLKTGISWKNISSCCTGKRRHAGGYGWKYAE